MATRREDESGGSAFAPWGTSADVALFPPPRDQGTTRPRTNDSRGRTLLRLNCERSLFCEGRCAQPRPALRPSRTHFPNPILRPQLPKHLRAGRFSIELLMLNQARCCYNESL